MKKISHRLKDKVFTVSDITRIAKLIESNKSKLISLENEETKRFVRFVVTIECEDRSINEFENLDFLEDDLKGFGRIIEISIKVNSFLHENFILFSLDSHRGYGQLIVEGKDRDWVDAKYSQLMNAISLVKPQVNWYNKYRYLIFNIASISLGIIPWFLLTSFFSLVLTPIESPSNKMILFKGFTTENPWIFYIINPVSWWLLGGMWARMLMEWVSKLWPSIEFDFGHEHLNFVKERRKRIRLATSMVIMPIVLAVIKGLIGKYL